MSASYQTASFIDFLICVGSNKKIQNLFKRKRCTAKTIVAASKPVKFDVALLQLQLPYGTFVTLIAAPVTSVHAAPCVHNTTLFIHSSIRYITLRSQLFCCYKPEHCFAIHIATHKQCYWLLQVLRLLHSIPLLSSIISQSRVKSIRCICCCARLACLPWLRFYHSFCKLFTIPSRNKNIR